jgi:hypothetical protein
MGPVITRQALARFGNLAMGRDTFQTNWIIHLFVNFHVPTYLDLVSDYVECTWPGYAPLVLFPLSWEVISSSGDFAEYQYPLLTWNLDASGQGGQTVFGYYVEQGGLLLYAEMFPAPFPIPPDGGQIPIQLYFTDEQCAG